MDLASLYACLPAAEEEDLLEEVARERLDRWREREALAWSRWPASGPLVDLLSPDALPDDVPAAETADEEPPAAFGEAQVLGMLQHHLGAVVVARERPGAHSR